MPTVRQHRVRLRLSQKEFGARAGVSHILVVKAEKQRPITRQSAEKIARFLGVNVGELEGLKIYDAVQAKNKDIAE